MHGFPRKLKRCSNLVAEKITRTNQFASKPCAPPDTREYFDGTSLIRYCAWYGVVGPKTLCSSCSKESLFSICGSIGIWKSWYFMSATTMEGTGFTEGSKSVDFAGKPCAPFRTRTRLPQSHLYLASTQKPTTAFFLTIWALSSQSSWASSSAGLTIYKLCQVVLALPSVFDALSSALQRTPERCVWVIANCSIWSTRLRFTNFTQLWFANLQLSGSPH